MQNTHYLGVSVLNGPRKLLKVLHVVAPKIVKHLYNSTGIYYVQTAQSFEPATRFYLIFYNKNGVGLHGDSRTANAA